MKTAKEWAAEVVKSPECETGRWAVHLEDDEDFVPLERQTEMYDADSIASDACGIIERLVMRVQADARAPLEGEIARLRADKTALEGVARRALRIAGKRVGALKEEVTKLKEEAWHRERLVAAWIGALGGVQSRLRGALPGNELAAEVRRIIRDIEAQLTL